MLIIINFNYEHPQHLEDHVLAKNVGFCYILSTTSLCSLRGGAEPPLCCIDCAARGSQGGWQPPLYGGFERCSKPPLHGVQSNALRNFFLDPIFGWANLRMVLCMVLDTMVFGPWFWTRWFSVHGIGCFGLYKYVL